MASTAAAHEALARRTDPDRDTILSLIERQRPAIERALPNAIGADRFARIVVTEIKRNPQLLECAPDSLLGALMLCAQLGLEPGPLGHAYLVPYKRVCTFILGYTGMIDLARRSDRLGNLKAQIVYEHDDYEFWETERGPHLRYKPAAVEERGKRRLVYARWTTRAGRAFVADALEVYPDEIERARKRSPAARANSGPWLSDEDAMWRKTAIRRARPYLPATPLLGRAFEADEGIVRGLEADGEVEVEEEATE